jgi:hypothetical protein
MTLFLTIWIGIGMSIDCVSCCLELRRIVKGHGPSGIPLATLIVFYLLPLLLTKHAVVTESWIADAVLLSLFHVLAVFLIPMLFSRWTTRRRSAD